jgi:putative membrane protein
MSTMIQPILIVGIAIMCTVWYMRHKWRRRRARSLVAPHNEGLELLATRYARGEISREEYLQKRDDILADRVLLQIHQ